MQRIGIYQDGSQLKIAALSSEHLIERLAEQTSFSKEEWSGLVVSGIDGDRTLVRHIESPLKSRRSLQKTLPFQLESLIPFSIDEVIVQPVYETRKENTQAIFFVTLEESLKHHLNKLREIEPSWVSCVPMALYRFACFIGQDRDSYTIFHFGKETTEIVSIEQGVIYRTLSLRWGMNHFEAAYQKDGKNLDRMQQLDLSKLESKDSPHLVELLQRFQQEVDRFFCFLTHKQKINKLKFLLFTGETDKFFPFEKWLKSWVSFSYEVLPVKEQCGVDPHELKSYAISIGLALDAIKQDRKSIQFRQGKWIAPAVYAKIKRKLLRSALLSFACAATILVASYLIYTKQEKRFLREIDEFGNLYEKEIPPLEAVCLLPSAEEKLGCLDRQLKLVKNDYSYFVTPPLVADLLAFLSEHPKLNRHEGEKKIVIDDLLYELIEYPSIQNPNQPYKVKVSLTFTSPESTWAREFHDAVVLDANWVNQEEPITWEREQNAYTFSFILN